MAWRCPVDRGRAKGRLRNTLLEDNKAEPDETVLDEAFYRRFKRMLSETERRLRQTLDAWGEEP